MLVSAALAVTAILSTATASAGSPSGASGTEPLDRIVPQPAEVRTTPGVAFDLDPDGALYATAGSGDAKAAADFLAGLLRKPTGYALPVRGLSASAKPAGIVLALGGANSVTKPEGYQLQVTSRAVTISADDRQGLFNGVATLRQLLPVKADRQERMPGPWRIRGGVISDAPRYAYRGALLDVARHHLPDADVKKYIDTIARYKINYLHMHLIDDQGWRLQIKSWPELTTIGGSTGTGGILGGFYTQEQYKSIVDYAYARGVTVIPEIEGPIHMHSALASYAELNCDGKAPEPYTGWLNSEDGRLCLDSPVTYEFLDDVIGEIAALTPGPYIHIGGDEAHDLSQAELDGHFEKVAKLVEKHGKKVFGWQEAAGSFDPATTMTEFWTTGINDEQVIAAGKAGGKVVMAPATNAYVDMKYTESYPEYPVGNAWAGTTTVADSYDWKPEEQLAGLPANSIAGVEAALFTETVFGINQAENLAFPRMLSIAEIGWAKASTHDWDTFKPRLAAQGPRLRESRVNYYPSPDVPWPLGS
ncbi:beta-N-acetylhexosaminidase [Streptomyces kunmingensis]|uniref:beta-N-acetylhexosaminidase n=1 Tax=Streptomyces kunmingensis TaxID=68225 RepID=A0ABU6C3H9_9ACTN|nr:beta-N-acetylhexosaminidase [Streptomyces kunmingensis]MEB3959098.1 beta-N-acetylhexosaminidase [Streptomyces kunmingensis]